MCGKQDLNLHGIATASPSSWCVCQFRHSRGNSEPFIRRVLSLLSLRRSLPASSGSAPGWGYGL